MDICNIVDGDVSAEVISTNFEDMVREGEELAALHDNIVVKVPMIEDGVKALRYFSDKGIRTNCTLVFSAGQALLAAKAGADYVSPFIGRLDDISTDGLQLISQIRGIYDNYMFKTEILAASVRHTTHVIECAQIGADVMTGPLSAIKGLLKHRSPTAVSRSSSRTTPRPPVPSRPESTTDIHTIGRRPGNASPAFVVSLFHAPCSRIPVRAVELRNPPRPTRLHLRR